MRKHFFLYISCSCLSPPLSFFTYSSFLFSLSLSLSLFLSSSSLFLLSLTLSLSNCSMSYISSCWKNTSKVVILLPFLSRLHELAQMQMFHHRSPRALLVFTRSAMFFQDWLNPAGFLTSRGPWPK